MALPNLAVGTSVDVHAFKKGIAMYLGGVKVTFDRGMDGHSDGDVLMHAVLDALLSAADLPDLGTLFPDTDEKNRGRSSVDMAREVARRLSVAGTRILSIDAVVLAEEPKIAPIRGQLRESIAAALDIEVRTVNVKGKTYERMGPIGKGECIEARAIALVERGYTTH